MTMYNVYGISAGAIVDLCIGESQKNEAHIVGVIDKFREANGNMLKKHTEQYMETLLATKEQKKQADTDRLKRELKAAGKRIGDLSKILTKLYEDMALERISEERYQAMAPGYEREQALLRTRRKELSREIESSEEMYENIEKFLPVIWKYTDIETLDARILNEPT